jgi:TolA-binding protein
MRAILGCLLLVVALVGAPTVAAPAFAQSSTTVTSADVDRLQNTVSELDREISQMRTSDQQGASQLQTDLDNIRDEVVYLRVKLRREGTVTEREYTDVRDRLDNLRSRVRGDRTSGRDTSGIGSSSTRDTTAAGTDGDRHSSRSGESIIPVGQEIDVRLQDSLNSGRNQVEDRFTATTLVDLQVDERTVIPAGSELRGVVSSVNPAGRIDRKGSITVTFDQITIDNRTYPMRGTVTQALESEGVRGEVGKIGAGAGVGAIIGGILGGLKGALAGVLIGGGGVIAATEGTDVDLPAGTVLRVRLDSPPAMR